ncbi:AAA family ATPase [Paracoccus laeviglucosivorans]|uniref:AAA ATPase domain-containing protein n=1 Tax=Paracoccus laeviglucosivorans TaxID=1197861 RepID=A0A521CXF7_9RHOB|nr:DUF3696 domain-containing protein [Paracoccus laeviglucosivorans]SMO64135.1 Protein of unknown function [Paracoccus laeviglucosivorans]
MLKNWRVKNFKSFSGEHEIELSPLTIFSGANSSGKSSIIQSILLIKQTLNSSSPGRPIALNGPLVQLGGFSDILNQRAATNGIEREISFGWDIAESFSPDYDGQNHSAVEEGLESIATDFSISDGKKSISGSVEDIHPTLTVSKVRSQARDFTGNIHENYLSIRKSSGKGRKLKINTHQIDGSLNPSAYVVTEIDKEMSLSAVERYKGGKVAGCATRHFLPSNLFVRFDRGLFNAQVVMDAILGEETGRRLIKVYIPESAFSVASEIWRTAIAGSSSINAATTASLALESLSVSPLVSDYSKRLRSIHISLRRKILEDLRGQRVALTNLVKEAFPADLTLVRSEPGVLQEISEANEYFFRFGINYVGPLRSEPKPLYALQLTTAADDVGARGEWTAAVLSRNGDASVITIDPKQFAHDGKKVRIECSLKEAVTAWLQYLGVATDVETLEKGKLGHEIRVRPSPDGDFRDLTNVGVGLSQVLPVLVSCLVASEGSLMLLEQPELHLHPRVQARLADFFAVSIELGQQFIIETHSEHIIERLRLRITEPDGEKLNNKLRTYFFSQSDGCTTLRPVEFSKYGAVIDWPDDFFDQSQKQSAHILKAAMARRLREKSDQG